MYKVRSVKLHYLKAVFSSVWLHEFRKQGHVEIFGVFYCGVIAICP